jgi:hypothetical protein
VLKHLNESVNLQNIDCNFLFYYSFLSIILYNAMNSKRDILYNIKVRSIHNDLLLLARFMPIHRNDFVLLGHLKRFGGKWVSLTTQ